MAKLDAVFAFGEDMQLCWNSRLPQRLVKKDAVLRRHGGILIRVEQKRGRRVPGDVQLIRELLDERGIRVRPEQILDRFLMSPRCLKGNNRIGENREIRTAGNPVYRVRRACGSRDRNV